METQSHTPASSEVYTTGQPCNCVRVDSPPNAYTVHKGVCCHCRGTVEVPSFFKTERCLITRAYQPPKVYQPCTDLLPRTMSWLAAGVPTDFIDRADARMARMEAPELNTEMVLIPDGNGPNVRIEPASATPFPEWDLVVNPPVGDEREAFFWRALLRTYGEEEQIERSNLGDYGFAQVPDPSE